MKTLLFIFNSRAGKGTIRSRLAGILDAFVAEGWLPTCCPTRSRADATRLARELGPSYDRVVCSGGDGTLHEVIEGLMGVPEDQRPPIGYIPAGTTNDFARNLNLPRGMEKMAHLAVTGDPCYVDIGRLNDAYFIYVTAFGAFTDVSYSTPQEVKNTLGHLAYLLQGATEIGNLQSHNMTVEYDGGQVSGEFIFGMVTNTVSVAGMLDLTPQKVVLDDGILEALLVKTPQNPVEANAAVMALATGNFSDPSTGLIFLRSSQFHIKAEKPVPMTVDGEFGGNHTDCVIAAVNRPVRIVCGK